MSKNRAFKLADPLPKRLNKLLFKNDIGSECMFGRRREKPGVMVFAIEFLCKIEISRFVTCL